jgi:iron complex outermembrane receptor protein
LTSAERIGRIRIGASACGQNGAMVLTALLPMFFPPMLLATGEVAAPTADASRLPAVQVTATRLPREAARVPAAVTVIDADRLARPSRGVNLSEKLQEVPGLLARERQNYAQDLQVSVRGFGARATFGIRGIRLFLDGIPATMPDGQGQVSNFNLASAGRIEVLRGPFSALYGNAAGRVIQVFTADGAADPGLPLSLGAGSHGDQRKTLDWRGADGALDYVLDYTHFRTDGYREHSGAARESFNARLKYASGARDRFVLVANALDAPEAEDPLGLTQEQMAADPRQAPVPALLFDTRKSVSHQQLGLVWEHDTLKSGSLRVQVHGGERQVVQFLSVPVAAQLNPLSGGGVVDLDSDFAGIDLRWSVDTQAFGRPLEWVLGVDADRQRQHRLGYENFSGGELGVRGALRRDQMDSVGNTDLYLQGSWTLSPATELMAGLRRSRVHFDSNDRYVTTGNPDDSGEATYSATTPVLGLSHRLGASWTTYASFGRGFETPTFDELGYRPDGNAGLNFDLDPARTRSVEVGARAAYAGGASMDFTLFRADTRDELAVASNSGGRSTYHNIGDARRQGFEASLLWPLRAGWKMDFAGTWMQAEYRDPFLACAGSPCPVPTVPVAAGADIPGVPRAWASLGVEWASGDRWWARLGARRVGSVLVDSARDVRADAYTVVDAEATLEFPLLGAKSRVFLRLENLFDRRYAGSVIVGEANGRYFEPAPGRSLFAGVDLHW